MRLFRHKKMLKDHRIFRHRKAMFNVLIAVIITIIVGLLLFVIGAQIHKRMKGVDDDEACRLSILANTQIGKVQKGSKGFVGTKVGYSCPRKSLEIEFDKKIRKAGKIDDDLLKKRIGRELASCWTKVGAGKMDPFQSSKTVDDKFCLVCTDVIFKKSFVEQAKKQQYSLKGFEYWMADPANKIPGVKGSLYEFITGKEVTNELLDTLAKTKDSDKTALNFDEKYVIAWRVEKYEPGCWRAVGAAIAGAVVAVGAVAAGIISLPVGGVGVAIIGAGVGVGVEMMTSGDVVLHQQVHLLPEETLSYEMVFQKGQDPKEFCTTMVN
jgi:hypothetical protein